MKLGTVVQHVNDDTQISPVGLVMGITKNSAGKEVASVLWDSDILADYEQALYHSWEFVDKLSPIKVEL